MLATPRFPRRLMPAVAAWLASRHPLLARLLGALPLSPVWRDQLDGYGGSGFSVGHFLAATHARLWCWCLGGTCLPDLSPERDGHIRLRRERWPAAQTELTRRVAAYARRIWHQRIIGLVARSALAALLILTLGAALYVTRGTGGYVAFAWPLAVAVLLLGVVVALAHQVTLPDAARIADRKLEARARISTALELQVTGAKGLMVQQQYDQTLARVRRFAESDVVPLQPPWHDVRLFCATGLVCLGLVGASLSGFSLVDQRERALQRAIDDETRKIENVQRQLAVSNPRNSTDPQAVQARQQVAQSLEKLVKDLRAMKGTNPGDTLARLSDAERELMQQARDLNYSDAALERLADSLSDLAVTSQAAEAMKSGRTDQAAQGLSQLAGDLDKLSEQSRQDLVNRLREAAQQMGPSSGSQNMRDAAQRASNALNDRNRDAAAQALKDLAREIQNQGRQQAAQEAIGRGLSQVQEAERNIRQSMGDDTANGGTDPDSSRPDPGERASPASSDDMSDMSRDLDSMAGDGLGAGTGTGNYSDLDGMYGLNDDLLDRPNRAAEKGGGAGDGEPPADLSSLGVGGRLNVDGKSIEVDLNPEGNGSGSGRFSLVPADISNGSVNVDRSDTGNGSDTIVTSGDANNVPWNLRNYVRDYFSQLSGR